MGTVAPSEPQPMGGCGQGQEFDSMLLIATPAQTVTCDPMCSGWPETRSPGEEGSLRTAEPFDTLRVEALF